MASIRFPPLLDIGFAEDSKASIYSQFNFDTEFSIDWGFLYKQVGVKMEDSVLEVRLKMILLHFV